MIDKKDYRVFTGIIKVTIFIILLAVLFFMCAGRFDLTGAWIFLVSLHSTLVL
jgi:hypothetical protein